MQIRNITRLTSNIRNNAMHVTNTWSNRSIGQTQFLINNGAVALLGIENTRHAAIQIKQTLYKISLGIEVGKIYFLNRMGGTYTGRSGHLCHYTWFQLS